MKNVNEILDSITVSTTILNCDIDNRLTREVRMERNNEIFIVRDTIDAKDAAAAMDADMYQIVAPFIIYRLNPSIQLDEKDMLAFNVICNLFTFEEFKILEDYYKNHPSYNKAIEFLKSERML